MLGRVVIIIVNRNLRCSSPLGHKQIHHLYSTTFTIDEFNMLHMYGNHVKLMMLVDDKGHPTAVKASDFFGGTSPQTFVIRGLINSCCFPEGKTFGM